MSEPAFLLAESSRSRAYPDGNLLVLVGTWAGDQGVAGSVLVGSGRRGAILPHGDHWHVLLENRYPETDYNSVPWEIAASRVRELSSYMGVASVDPDGRYQTDVDLILAQLAYGRSSAFFFTDL